MTGRWVPPGQKPSASNWTYDWADGWGIGSGQEGGMQFEMAPGAYPGPTAAMPNFVSSPAGQMAPLDSINFTPSTGEFSPPGVAAPADQENISLVSGSADVTEEDARTALRRRSLRTRVSPMRQAQEMLHFLGLSPAQGLDAPEATPGAPATGLDILPRPNQPSIPSVGSGEAAPASDPTMTMIQQIIHTMLQASSPPYLIWSALTGGGLVTQDNASQVQQMIEQGSSGSSSTPSSGDRPYPTGGTGPQSAGQSSGAPVTADSNGAPQQSGGKTLEDFLGGQGGAISAGIYPVTGGYVQVGADGKATFFPTAQQGDSQQNEWIQMGGGALFNTRTGQIVQAPVQQTPPEQQTPTPLGDGWYWNPQTGQMEQVPQKEKPTQLQPVQQADGTVIFYDPFTGQEVSRTPGPDSTAPNAPMATPTGDVVVWNPETGRYDQAYQQTRYILGDGSIVDIQPDGTLRYVYKAPKQFTVGDSIVQQDPETGAFSVPFTMPEEQAPGWLVRSIQHMFPDAFTPEAMVGPEYTAAHPSRNPWKPKSPGPAQGSMAPGGAPGERASSGAPPGSYDPNTAIMDGNGWPTIGDLESFSPWIDTFGGLGDRLFQGFHGADGEDSILQPSGSIRDEWPAAALSWNPFATGRPRAGTGQDVGSGHAGMSAGMFGTGAEVSRNPWSQAMPESWQSPIGAPPSGWEMHADPHQFGVAPIGSGQDGYVSPVDPAQVVGAGHAFGEGVSMEGVHKGTDLQAYKGTPARSPVNGTVVSLEDDPAGLGLQVVIEDANGNQHRLSHLDAWSVEEGQPVTAGDVVGTVGESGAGASGPHLDVREQDPAGNYLNPERHFPDLAALPRADTPDALQQEFGVGQAYQPITFNSILPGIPGPGIPGGANGPGIPGYGGPFAPDDLTTLLPYLTLSEQIKAQMQQMQQQYAVQQQQMYQDWLVHRDNLAYQRDALNAQMQFQEGQNTLNAQMQFIQPWIEAAFNHPWLQRLSGMGPGWGQPGGPGGADARRLGAGDGLIAQMAKNLGFDLPKQNGPSGISVPEAMTGQTQGGIGAPLETGPAFSKPKNQREYDKLMGSNNPKAWAKAEKKFPTTTGWVPKRGVLDSEMPWEVYAQMTPQQRAGLRTDLSLRGINFGDWSAEQVENWGESGGPTEMPGMTMLHAVTQDPLQREGTAQLTETFGNETPEQYYQRQQRKWSLAAAPGVSQGA